MSLQTVHMTARLARVLLAGLLVGCSSARTTAQTAPAPAPAPTHSLVSGTAMFGGAPRPRREQTRSPLAPTSAIDAIQITTIGPAGMAPSGLHEQAGYLDYVVTRPWVTLPRESPAFRTVQRTMTSAAC